VCPRTAAAQAEIRGPAGTWQQDGGHCLRKTELPTLCGRPGAGGSGRESSQLEHLFVPKSYKQCFGSGSTGCTCFWAIRIHLSEVWTRIRLRILISSSKNSKKNLDSYCFVTSFGLFVFEKLNRCTFKK
jgi:hypothetical protein